MKFTISSAVFIIIIIIIIIINISANTMKNIKFIFKEKCKEQYRHTDTKTIRQCVDRYFDRSTIYGMKFGTNHVQNIRIDVYVQKKLINDLDVLISDFFCNNNHVEIINNKRYIKLTIKIYTTIVKELSDEQLNRPIIDYLVANNLNRACWVFDKHGKQTIDVNNIFNHYVGSNHCSDSYNFIGHMYHKKQCNIESCDLIACVSSYDGTHYNICDRCSLYRSMFLTNINEFNLCLPVISNKKTMINNFFQHINMNVYYHCLAGNNNYYHSIKPCELDIYCVTQITHTDTKSEESVGRMNQNDNYVLDFFETNKEILSENIGCTEHVYVFVPKSIRLNDFYQTTKYLPIELLDIIYMYVDFESVEPNVSDIF